MFRLAVGDAAWLDETTLYFADVGGHVYALDTETHEMLWREPALIEDVLRSRPALNADGSLLYVAGYEKGVHPCAGHRDGRRDELGYRGCVIPDVCPAI